MPAFYCGIFGHKPTVGAVNTKGCTFRSGRETSTMVVAGPMTRHAKDLLPLLKVRTQTSHIDSKSSDSVTNMSIQLDSCGSQANC